VTARRRRQSRTLGLPVRFVGGETAFQPAQLPDRGGARSAVHPVPLADLLTDAYRLAAATTSTTTVVTTAVATIELGWPAAEISGYPQR
jgi:hypothetical protein